jgi:hypothetical protein
MSKIPDNQEPLKKAKKISGEYFKDNRDFVKVPGFLQDYIKECIEPQRQEKAILAEHLANAQKESRKKKFGAYGIDMPLPELKKETYLSKILPIDAFLYVLYGAILWEKPIGMEISRDARDLMEQEYLKLKEPTQPETEGNHATETEDAQKENMKEEEEKGEIREQHQAPTTHRQKTQGVPLSIKLLCGITLGVVGMAIFLAFFYFLH